MNDVNRNLEAIILMGPFGTGKSYLGKRLSKAGIASYLDLEAIIYERFGLGDAFDLEQATAFLKTSYEAQLSASEELVAFESTGVVQRPLLLEFMSKYNIALVRVCTPKSICLDRVAKRNPTRINPIAPETAAEFFEFWTNEIASTYQFALEVDGTDEYIAIEAIKNWVLT